MTALENTQPYPRPGLISAAVAVVSPAGDASFAIPVPAQAGLVGVSLFHQWAVLDPGNALGLVLSNGAQAKIGE